jgi:hypothetical protein
MVMKILLNGDLSDWDVSERIDRGDVPRYNILANAQDDMFYFAISAPVAVGANTTVWFNTDRDAASGCQVFGFAGGDPANVDAPQKASDRPRREPGRLDRRRALSRPMRLARPVVALPVRDYGVAAWNTGTNSGPGSPYTTQMFTNFVANAYVKNYEFLTLERLQRRDQPGCGQYAYPQERNTG